MRLLGWPKANRAGLRGSHKMGETREDRAGRLPRAQHRLQEGRPDPDCSIQAHCRWTRVGQKEEA